MRTLIKHPILLLITAIIMVFYCIFEYNLLLPVLFSFSAIGVGNFFESAMSFIQLIFSFMTSPGLLSMTLVYLVAVLLVVSLFFGVLFAGFFNMINNTLEKKPRFKGEFFLGLKKYSIRMFLINMRVLLFSILYIPFIMIVCVPAIAATRAAMQGKAELLAGSILVDVVTVCVLFFGILFYRMYILFWYPSALVQGKKAFSRGKQLADRYFWRITKRIVAFDLIFLFLGGMLLIAKLVLMHEQNMNSVLMFVVLVVDWVFKTLFFGTFILYVFAFFKKHYDLDREQAKLAEEN
ncbi:MAG: hypothetical protein N2484_09350 [Clostridia bacterium]|nr:hypothetical protein [Clostridia bacterium]